MLNLNGKKEEEVWIPNLEGRLLITGMDCLQQCGHGNIEAVTACRNPGFSMAVTGRKSSTLWECSISHAFEYYPAVRKKNLGSTLYIEEMKIAPLSVFVGHGYLQQGGLQ